MKKFIILCVLFASCASTKHTGHYYKPQPKATMNGHFCPTYGNQGY